MADFNCCTFTGRLGADPEVRYLTTGQAVASFSVACGESWKDKDGNKKERVEWVKVVTFGKLAEICGEHLRKGKQVLVSGKMQTRSWEDKDGNKKYTTEIVANTMQMLGSRESGKQEDSGAIEPEVLPPDIDDCPF